MNQIEDILQVMYNSVSNICVHEFRNYLIKFIKVIITTI